MCGKRTNTFATTFPGVLAVNWVMWRPAGAWICDLIWDAGVTSSGLVRVSGLEFAYSSDSQTWLQSPTYPVRLEMTPRLVSEHWYWTMVRWKILVSWFLAPAKLPYIIIGILKLWLRILKWEIFSWITWVGCESIVKRKHDDHKMI